MKKVEFVIGYRKQTDVYLFYIYDISTTYNHITILSFYITRDAFRSTIETDHRHSPMRKIIISPCNYAVGIICNPLPSSSPYCFPTRSIEMAFDRISRQDRIKISGPLSRIHCSPLRFVSILGNSSRSVRTQDRANHDN